MTFFSSFAPPLRVLREASNSRGRGFTNVLYLSLPVVLLQVIFSPRSTPFALAQTLTRQAPIRSPEVTANALAVGVVPLITTIAPDLEASKSNAHYLHNAPWNEMHPRASPGTKKKQILVVVDMENSYCDKNTCPWYDPAKVDGPGYSHTPRSWLGPGCGDKCTTKKDCIKAALKKKPKKKRASGFVKSIKKLKCKEGMCACDSEPSERDVISYITKIIGTTKKEDGSSYWDYIIFTHDWDDYGQVCSIGQGAKDNNVGDLYGPDSPQQCWKQSAEHGSNVCGPDKPHKGFKQAGCTSSLVAWSKGTDIVKPLQHAVNKALKTESGMQSDRVVHVVKKHANWGLARHQPMNIPTAPQGKMTPYYLMEDLNIDPRNTALTVTGSFTQYCVIAGVFQMVLSGFSDIVLAEAATGGYGDSQANRLCTSGEENCPKPPPPITSTWNEKAAWMSNTAQGRGDFPTLPDSVNKVQTTKSNALMWMKKIGLTVMSSKKGAPLEEGWKNYIDWMDEQGAKVPGCFIKDWCK